MYRTIYLYLAIFIFFIANESIAQQQPTYSQYMMNAFLVNPAVAGHEGYTSINATVREQWVGLEDAPSTYALSAQTRLLKNSFISRSASIRRRRRVMSRSGRVGFGGYVFTDRNGVFNRTGFQATYAYHLTLRRSQVSFGASLMGFQFNIDKNKIITLDDDVLLNSSSFSTLVPDANFGVYYSDRNIYAGISVQNLFQSILKISDNKDGISYRMARHYYFMAGYRYDLIDFLFVEPSFLFKTTLNKNEPGETEEDEETTYDNIRELRLFSQLDLNLKFYFKEDYWAGISFRTGGGSKGIDKTLKGRGASFIVMAGARVDKYYFGYAFDYTFSSIMKRTIGSHELMLALKFGDNARRYRWLNRY